jgi:hypoxanthine-DNA glycosylase
VGSLRGLAPLIDERARVLILGSFPSEASLAAQQYYAHPQNQFWRILGAILARPLAEMDYAARQAAVRQAGIAIWDVYGGCLREGSLDADIRSAEPNDLAKLKQIAPRLRRACFNGKTAGKFAPRLAALGFETVVLPSTSPAYTLAFPAKLEAWRNALSAS